MQVGGIKLILAKASLSAGLVKANKPAAFKFAFLDKIINPVNFDGIAIEHIDW